MDCLAGFQGNRIRIERQGARIIRPVGQKNAAGKTVMMMTSLEDPTSPDVIHHRISRSQDFVDANSEIGLNEQQICRAIIVFIFAYWDEDVRPNIAKVRGVSTSDVLVDAFGDLRLIRHGILHNKGMLPSKEHGKLKKMKEIFSAGAEISLTHDKMHKLFITLKQGVAELILVYTGNLPGAPNASDIVGIAIQNPGPRKP